MDDFFINIFVSRNMSWKYSSLFFWYNRSCSNRILYVLRIKWTPKFFAIDEQNWTVMVLDTRDCKLNESRHFLRYLAWLCQSQSEASHFKLGSFWLAHDLLMYHNITDKVLRLLKFSVSNRHSSSRAISYIIKDLRVSVI